MNIRLTNVIPIAVGIGLWSSHRHKGTILIGRGTILIGRREVTNIHMRAPVAIAAAVATVAFSLSFFGQVSTAASIAEIALMKGPDRQAALEKGMLSWA